MCLAVYLGTSSPLEIAQDVPSGALGIEPAKWTPPPLARHRHVYYLGRKGEKPKLECSCLLVEHIDWTERGPRAFSDALYPDDGPCPFEQLRTYCETACRSGGTTTIVCDDGGGEAQECEAEDYSRGMIRLDQIARGNLIFCDPSGGLPWRELHVVNIQGIETGKGP